MKTSSLIYKIIKLVVLMNFPHIAYPSEGFIPPAKPFPLEAVKLLDSPFKRAMQLDAEYLLSLEPDRLLAGFREEANLKPKAPKYGGWESTQVAGHTLGHYLSACSMMFADTGDERFRQRVAYIVDELEGCQNAHGDGYLSAIPEGKKMFEELSKGNLEPYLHFWAPWYVIHKLLAGLLDAHRYCGNEKALKIACKLADWVEATLKNLNEEQIQQMLSNEHGGMVESLAELYARTKDERYLALSKRFYHQAVMDLLLKGIDCLPGLHGNTQIPKVIGMARLYELTGEGKYRIISEFFWDRVVQHHSYVVGGFTSGEVFGPPDQLNDRLTDNTAETCKTYNLLKLTKHLFSWQPSAEKADYYERALYNHILASQHPKTGMMIYYLPLRPGAFKVYSTPFDSFWCCVGTGMENHARYGEFIYFHRDDALFVNLFIPSELMWKEKNLTLRLETKFPEEENVSLLFSPSKPIELTIYVRAPGWVKGTPLLSVNGEEYPISAMPGSYIALRRVWEKGDRIELRLPMGLHTEALPDNPNRQAILYGPIVLAGDLGSPEEPEPIVPAFVTQDKPLDEWLKPVKGKPLHFRTVGVGKPRDVELYPLYLLHDRRYTVYWDFLTPSEWREREKEIKAEQELIKDIEERTIDRVLIGNEKSEKEHNLKGEKTGAGVFGAEHWRHSVDGGWFSYVMRVEPDRENQLAVKYWGSDAGGRVFDILIDGVVIGKQELKRNKPGRFFYVIYPIPEELTKGKDKVEVKFRAEAGKMAGGIFDLRVLRK
ncbi:glycoside hydrolase family 127 protein [bacterium]|nr:glycoside hydrolase family 127 protein [bacterium]